MVIIVTAESKGNLQPKDTEEAEISAEIHQQILKVLFNNSTSETSG